MTSATRQAAAPRAARGPVLPDRLLSLDAYRGFIMLLLVSQGFGLASLAAYPGFAWIARQVEHAEWTGITCWDLIQPAFTFMVGVAMPFALERRRAQGATFTDLARHVCWRAMLLVLLSNLFSNFGEARLRFELINVLSQIAFGYVICFLVLQMPRLWQVAAGALLLGVQWLLFVTFPGPQGPFSQVGNVGQVIDHAVLGYNYSGFYVTINFLGNAVVILFGCWTGVLVRAGRSHRATLAALGGAAAGASLAGLALMPFDPVIKRLWTASFTFLGAAAVIVMLMGFYWLIEVRGWRKWTFPFVVVGMNSIFIYSFWQLLGGWLDSGLATFTGRFAFLGAAGAIPHRLVVVAVMWWLCYWLYKRRIFLKI